MKTKNRNGTKKAGFWGTDKGLTHFGPRGRQIDSLRKKQGKESRAVLTGLLYGVCQSSWGDRGSEVGERITSEVFWLNKPLGGPGRDVRTQRDEATQSKT